MTAFLLSAYLLVTGIVGLLFYGLPAVVLLAPSTAGSIIAIIIGLVGAVFSALPDLRRPRAKRGLAIIGGLMMLASIVGVVGMPHMWGLVDYYIHAHAVYVLFVGSIALLLIGLEPEPELMPAEAEHKYAQKAWRHIARPRHTPSHA